MDNTTNSPDRVVLALVRDLIFASKISASARAAGIEARIIRDPAQLAGRPASLLLADLNQAGVIDAVAEWKRATGGQVIGFVSHVDTSTIAQAKQAGLDRVLARSGFVELLPHLMTEVAGRK